MAEKTTYLCDRCGDSFPNSPGKLWVQTDRRMDAAGSMEDVGLTVDVCHKCAVAVLGAAAKAAWSGQVFALKNCFPKARAS